MYTAMIVEDELFVRNSIRVTMDWASCGISEVYEAANGHEALEVYRTYHPEIILTDLKMPVMDGMTLIRTIRAEDKSVRFIIMSCLDEFNLVQEALNLGVMHYFFKLTTSCEDIQQILCEITANLDESHMRDTKLMQRNAEQILARGDALSSADIDSLFHAAGIDRKTCYRLCVFCGGTLSETLHPIRMPGEYCLIILPENTMPTLPPGGHAGLCQTFSRADDFPLALSQAKKALTGCFFESVSVCLYHGSEYFTIPAPLTVRLMALPDAFIHLPSRFVAEYRMRVQPLTQRTYTAPEEIKKALCRIIVWLSSQADFKSGDPEDLSIDSITGIQRAKTLEESVELFSAFVTEVLRLSSFSQQIPENVLRALVYINSHLDQAISLNDIANYVHLNASYLSTLFGKVMRQSIVSYINAARLERAKLLLTHTDMPVKAIASAIGFSQEIYFYRLFKKQEHVTPSAYRAAVRGAGQPDTLREE